MSLYCTLEEFFGRPAGPKEFIFQVYNLSTAHFLSSSARYNYVRAFSEKKSVENLEKGSEFPPFEISPSMSDHAGHTTVECCGVPVHFPFPPYAVQRKYMECVVTALQSSSNALLESPTGTGKTLSLLCATLAWQNEVKRMGRMRGGGSANVPDGNGNGNGNGNSRPSSSSSSSASSRSSSSSKVPTIIYASRTHSQLQQVLGELRRSLYRPSHVVLGAREHFCVHEKVSKLPPASVNLECGRINLDRKCRYRNGLENYGGGGEDVNNLVLDIEDLKVHGRKNKICPFYLSREKSSRAELILLPYNYIFDPNNRAALDICWENSVVIFDEAHNLESFASDALSFEFTSLDVGQAIHECESLLKLSRGGTDADDNNDDGGQISPANLQLLMTIFMNIERELSSQSHADKSYSGDWIFHFFDRCGLPFAKHQVFLKFLSSVAEYSDRKGAHLFDSQSSSKLRWFTSVFQKTFDAPDKYAAEARAKSYKCHVSSSTKWSPSSRSTLKVRTLHFWCFAPSLAMRSLTSLKVRSLIVTSGTLSPMESYALELGVPFPVLLENDHVIKPEQVSVLALPRGIAGRNLKSTYENRNDREMGKDLGNTIAALVKVIPGGVLCFFSSYGVMEMYVEMWGGPKRGGGTAIITITAITITTTITMTHPTSSNPAKSPVPPHNSNNNNNNNKKVAVPPSPPTPSPCPPPPPHPPPPTDTPSI